MINFQPDVVLPKDPIGFGLWLTGHYREHLQMNAVCIALTPSIHVPNYDIFGWKDDAKAVQQWLVAHESMHQVLRTVANVSGADLSLVDFSKDDEFLDWMDDHATEHGYFRTALGIS
jgi:hypothetical protein